MSNLLYDIQQLWLDGYDEHDIAITLKVPVKIVMDAVYTYSADWRLEEDDEE